MTTLSDTLAGSAIAARERARHFLEHEREFHLGALPTEQSHPKTRDLSRVIATDLAAGIRQLQTVDADLPPIVDRTLAGAPFARLTDALHRALASDRRIFLSGCGATGRVAILLEAAWRQFAGTAWADRVFSLMTGGDYALVRSVESFEDYAAFGRQQTREAGVGPGDVFVAITEGGETSSVIGSAWQALDAGADVFFVCNNPLAVLAAHVARSREIIAEPRITKLDLSSGPMAIAGSTRMQATTLELLVVGAALEQAGRRAARTRGEVADSGPVDYGPCFARLLQDLGRPEAIAALAAAVAFETETYAAGGAVTYFADRFLADIFTDTTERAPTFMLPPLRRRDDPAAPRPWACVKHPLFGTPDAWFRLLGHPPRCLAWDAARYRELGAAETIQRSPPRIGLADLLQFPIGNEPDPARHTQPADAAVLVLAGDETAVLTAPDHPFGPAARAQAAPFPRRAALCIGPHDPPAGLAKAVFRVPCELPPTPLRLWEHLAVKLVLNTLSTATMARLGRVTGNWMAQVETTNKKLVDRGTRLVAELAGVDYAAACYALHETMAELARTRQPGDPPRSAVAVTIERLRT